MVQKTKREYVEAIRSRYKKAGLEGKQRILDEFCAVCGYHRKHAIRLLNRSAAVQKRKPGRPSEYGESERKVLEVIWLTANRPCSIRFKAAIVVWLPYYEMEHGRVSDDQRKRLLRISARSLDRLMKPVRRLHGTRGRCGTRPGSLLKNQIPIKTDHADVNKPGVMEADTVAHCGNSLDGSFVWSLTLTDIFSGWTENRAVWNKGYEGVRQAIKDVEQKLPFALTGFHSDNGGEFLNHHLIRYFQERNMPVDYSRGRPYHKNDTAHVEQKNYTHVRLLLGYQRIDNEDRVPIINQLYEAWALFNNFFSPTLKLIEKKKVGSKYIKKYDAPQTPYQRLMSSVDIFEPVKTWLTEIFCNINPFALKRQIDFKQNQILKELR
jgi:hypothetical protein